MLGLGEAVLARRKDLGLSQTALAEMVGVHQTMIGFIERGEKLPSFDLLIRLQDALGVSLLPAPSAPLAAAGVDATQAVQP